MMRKLSFAFFISFGVSVASAKSNLKDMGLQPQLSYKLDYAHASQKELSSNNYMMGLLDLGLDIDLEKAIGLEKSHFFIDAIHNHGDQASEKVGDSFVFSNIEAPQSTKIFQMYFEKEIHSDWAIKLGLVDLNSEFFVTSSSSNLINSAFGISPVFAQTGVNGPSIYPTSALSARIKYVSPKKMYFSFGNYNAQAGDPDHTNETVVYLKNDKGFLNVIEMGYDPQEENFLKLSLDLWRYSQKIENLNTDGEKNNSGYYFITDKKIEDLGFFVKYSQCDKMLNVFDQSLELGMLHTGLFKSRPEDIFSLGLVHAHVSSEFQNLYGSESHESVIETNYKFVISKNISLQPDIQWIKNPGLDSAKNQTYIFMNRFQFEF